MAIPISAFFRAGASFTPSPVWSRKNNITILRLSCLCFCNASLLIEPRLILEGIYFLLSPFNSSAKSPFYKLEASERGIIITSAYQNDDRSMRWDKTCPHWLVNLKRYVSALGFVFSLYKLIYRQCRMASTNAGMRLNFHEKPWKSQKKWKSMQNQAKSPKTG